MQTLARICIQRPVFATMLIAMLIVTGIASYFRLGVDLFPKVEFPTVTVTTELRGASPEEIETQISKRIEEAVNTTSGIEELRSTSAEGVSIVMITFELDKDPDIGAQEVRDAVARILNQLPNDADQPVIEKLASDASPVINVVVSAKRELRETTKLVDDLIKKNIESLTGVGQVRFVGERTRQIQMVLDGDKLYSYNLNVERVRGAIAQQNVEIPGGRVDQGRREVSLRTLGRIEKPADFNKVIISQQGGAPIRFSDVGYVFDGVEEPRSLARLDGTPAVVLEIRKQSGTNALEVIEAVKNRVEELKKSLPADFKVSYYRDQSKFIRDSFEAVQLHLWEGALFAGIVVLVFMRSWRSTLIASIAIPTSVIATYTLMLAMDFTLNQITMLALVLMVGIVIDDAIVVLENIYRFMEEKGMKPMDAALEGTREIGLAVLATTLSLVIVFLPVALMSGIVGKFMSSFGYTAAFAVMVSLLVSFTMTPMLCSRFLKTPSPEDKKKSSKDTFIYRILNRPYMGLLRWSMRRRWAIVVTCILVFLSTIPMFMILGKDFLPKDDQSEFEITVRMPPGSSMDGTSTVLREIEKEARTLPGVQSLLASVGGDARRQVDRGSVLVQLVPEDERELDQWAIMNQARARLTRFRDLTIGVQPPQLFSGGGPQRDFQFYIQGPDLIQIDRYATTLKNKLAALPGVADLDSSYESGKPEFRVKVNRDKASDLNVSVASIANALRVLVGGDDQVTTFRDGEDRYDVQLRVDHRFRNTQDALSRLYVPSSTLGNVVLANVALVDAAVGPTQIERTNRQRQILLSANILAGQSLSNVLTVLNQEVAALNMPAAYTTGLIGQSKEFGRAANNFLIAIALSFAFMYMILAAQFESFIDPITILLSLPMSIPFALLSLLLFRENFSIIYSSVGVLVLFGIVKKNSILQIDHIKRLRREGLPRLEAILKGCEDRLRPILMTTAALVAGMIPLALGQGAGAGSRRSAALVVIGGQTLCLLLTLLMTPVFYSLFDDAAHSPVWARIGSRFRRGRTRAVRAVTSLFLTFAMFALPMRGQTVPQRVGVGSVQRTLSLREAIEIAVSKNLELEVSRQNTRLAEAAVRAARGVFDPVFRYQPSISYADIPTASALQAPDGRLTDRAFNNNLALLGRSPTQGTSAQLTFDNARISTSNPFVNLTPYVQSRLTLAFTQPLLRGREIDHERTQIKLRRNESEIVRVDLELRVIDVAARVSIAYVDLLAAREDVGVAADTVNLAQRQLDQSLRQIQAGTLAPVEEAGARAELERRKDTYLQTLAAVTNVENNLKALLAATRTDPIWNEEIIPSDRNQLSREWKQGVPESVALAIERRPEMRVYGLQLKGTDLQKALAMNSLKPQLNLIASYTTAGLGGSVRAGDNPFSASNIPLFARINELSALGGLPAFIPPVTAGAPASLVGGYGTALSQVFQNSFPTYQGGVSFEWNLRNRTAQANVESAVLQSRQVRTQQAQFEQGIEAQVRNSLQSIETAQQRIAAADASALASEEKLASEQRLFATGESTNFLVLTRQNELTDSRRRAIGSRLELRRALINVERAVGTTLETLSIEVK